jgi:hypothetical protein
MCESVRRHQRDHLEPGEVLRGHGSSLSFARRAGVGTMNTYRATRCWGRRDSERAITVACTKAVTTRSTGIASATTTQSSTVRPTVEERRRQQPQRQIPVPACPEQRSEGPRRLSLTTSWDEFDSTVQRRQQAEASQTHNDLTAKLAVLSVGCRSRSFSGIWRCSRRPERIRRRR